MLLAHHHSERLRVRGAHGDSDLRRMFPHMPEQPGYHKIGEREVVAALLEHDRHLIRDGQVMLADKGFSVECASRFRKCSIEPLLGPAHNYYTKRPLTKLNHRYPQRRYVSNNNGLPDYQRPPTAQTMTS